ncbi:MAG: GGDEF domain-containing protein [Treponema sp.]|nr:GGDEF domain-containing protein [Treponema sp.]
MICNIWFDVCALVLAFVLLYMHAVRCNPHVRKNDAYRLLFAFIIISTITNLVRSVLENYNSVEDTRFLSGPMLITFVSFLYLAFHLSTCVAFIYYIFAVLNMEMTKSWQNIAFSMPLIAALGALIANFFTGCVFYYDSSFHFHRAPWIFFFYAAGAFYLLYSLVLMLRMGKELSLLKMFSFYSFVLIALLGALVQYFFPYLRVEPFSNMLVVFLIYLSIESPMEYIDSGTSLLNAPAFYFKAQTARHRNESYVFMLLELENMDLLDVSMGSEIVNSLLVDFSFFLRRLRGGRKVYRISRSVFAITLDNENLEQNKSFTQPLFARLKEPFKISGYEIRLTPRCCIIRLPKDASTEEELRRLVHLAADPSVYRGRKIIYGSDIDVAADIKKSYINRVLRSALDDGLMEICYQPVFSTKEKRFNAIEIKVVIKSKHYGDISAKDFLAMAEKNGSITRICLTFLQQVCDFYLRGNLEALGIETMEIIFPMSELLKADIASRVSAIIDRYEIPHSVFTFVLLEETIIHSNNKIIQNMNDLRSRGFRLSLDNYGAGYSNYGMLLKMPLYSVHLDKSITSPKKVSSKTDTILYCTVDLLRRLDFEIKAKHIDTVEQLQYATRFHCTQLQGYFFSKALHEQELLRLLKGARNEL